MIIWRVTNSRGGMQSIARNADDARSLCETPARSCVNEITTAHVMSVLEPIWTTKNDAANPARLAGRFQMILPRVSGLSRGHHKALDYNLKPAFLADLRKREAVSALALEFLILTAEKARDHEAPLCNRAIAILKFLLQVKTKTNPYLFPGMRPDRSLSEGAMAGLLQRRMKIGASVHGSRSSFRDRAGDETEVAREVIEAALAHSIGDKADKAYRRKTALAKRRISMGFWSVGAEPATSTSLGARGLRKRRIRSQTHENSAALTG